MFLPFFDCTILFIHDDNRHICTGLPRRVRGTRAGAGSPADAPRDGDAVSGRIRVASDVSVMDIVVTNVMCSLPFPGGMAEVLAKVRSAKVVVRVLERCIIYLHGRVRAI